MFGTLRNFRGIINYRSVQKHKDIYHNPGILIPDFTISSNIVS